MRVVKFPQTCYKCEERHVGCHGSCQRYKDGKAEYDAAVEAVVAKKRTKNLMDSYQVKAIRRAKKTK